jgi:hypothetical protein
MRTLPNLHKAELRETLGEDFQNIFLGGDKDTYSQVPIEVLQMWSRAMKGEPVGTLSGNAIQVEYSNPDVAQRLQVFYDTRRQYFGDEIWDIQSDYFKIQKGDARKAYLENHPELKAYWDYRKDYMYRNPDLAPYIEEDPDKWPQYPSEQALRDIQQQEPFFTPGEWNRILGRPAYNLTLDFIEGESMPDVAQDRLDELALQLGLSGWEDIAERLEFSLDTVQQ